MSDDCPIQNKTISDGRPTLSIEKCRKLFPLANDVDLDIIASYRANLEDRSLIAPVVKKLIEVEKTDSEIIEIIDRYEFKIKYEKDSKLAFTTMLVHALSDARIVLARFIFDRSKMHNGLCKDIFGCPCPLEISKLSNKTSDENIRVIDFLFRNLLLSKYGYWGEVEEDRVLIYILRMRSNYLAKWATGKIIDKTENGFGFEFNYDFTLEDLKFMYNHRELFDQKYLNGKTHIDIFDNSLKRAVRLKNREIILWFIDERISHT